MDESLVSILMNSYNSIKYVNEALQSIKAQSYQNWEVIFIDNHSTDGSGELAKHFDSRIKYFKTPEFCPLGEARNFGLTKVSGRFLCFLDTDDLWEPDKLSTQLDVHLNSIKPIALSYAGVDLIDADSKVIRKMRVEEEPSFRKLIKKYDINMQTVMVDLAVISDSICIEFDSSLSYNPDYKLFMSIASFFDVASIGVNLASYRVHEGALSGKLFEKQLEENIRVLEYLEVINIDRLIELSLISRQKKYFSNRNSAIIAIKNKRFIDASIYFLKLSKFEYKFAFLFVACLFPHSLSVYFFSLLNKNGFFRL